MTLSESCKMRVLGFSTPNFKILFNLLVVTLERFIYLDILRKV